MALQVPARLSNENIEAISNYLPYRADMGKSWSVIEAPDRKENLGKFFLEKGRFIPTDKRLLVNSENVNPLNDAGFVL